MQSMLLSRLGSSYDLEHTFYRLTVRQCSEVVEESSWKKGNNEMVENQRSNKPSFDFEARASWTRAMVPVSLVASDGHLQPHWLCLLISISGLFHFSWLMSAA